MGDMRASTPEAAAGRGSLPLVCRGEENNLNEKPVPGAGSSVRAN